LVKNDEASSQKYLVSSKHAPFFATRFLSNKKSYIDFNKIYIYGIFNIFCGKNKISKSYAMLLDDSYSGIIIFELVLLLAFCGGN
jgi:hypothetical protein